MLSPWRDSQVVAFILYSLSINKSKDSPSFCKGTDIFSDSFFNPVLRIHNYNTRSAANQSYYLPRARTNYGIFNIRFQGPKVWNSLGKDIKSTPFGDFKKQLKNELLCQYYCHLCFFVFRRAMSFFPVNSMIYLLLFVFKFSIYHNLS